MCPFRSAHHYRQVFFPEIIPNFKKSHKTNKEELVEVLTSNVTMVVFDQNTFRFEQSRFFFLSLREHENKVYAQLNVLRPLYLGD